MRLKARQLKGTMYAFLVLGLIPGTNIQISFQAWLFIAPVLLVAAIILRPRALQWWHKFGEDQASRRPLHASQLHLRAR
jgi:hypothetical protein